MIVERRAQRDDVADVGGDARHGPSRERLQARQHRAACCCEVVEHHRRVAGTARARRRRESRRSLRRRSPEPFRAWHSIHGYTTRTVARRRARSEKAGHEARLLHVIDSRLCRFRALVPPPPACRVRDGRPARPAPSARCRPGGSRTSGCAGSRRSRLVARAELVEELDDHVAVAQAIEREAAIGERRRSCRA